MMQEQLREFEGALKRELEDPFSTVREYLDRRGISEDVASALRWGLQKRADGDWITLPRFHGGQIVGLKYRSLAPNPQQKWRQEPGSKKTDFLYGAGERTNSSSETVFVAEGEHEVALIRSLGYNGVGLFGTGGVPRETTADFKADLDWMCREFKRAILIADNDAAGIETMNRLRKMFGAFPCQIANVPNHKDFGDLYQTDPVAGGRWISDTEKSPVAPMWESSFKTYNQLEQGPLPFLVNDFIPYGVTFFGGLAGCGKTWLSLSLAKALTTANPFLGTFGVPGPVPVIYLIPEVGDRSFRHRLEKMKLTTAGCWFLCRTMSSASGSLNDRELLDACKELRPAVILDTAIRFAGSGSENSASDNRQLSEGIFGLLKAGARGVICCHHSPKASRQISELTLETTLRGSGDIGAIADCVWALQRQDEDGDAMELKLKCVKPRDFTPPKPFTIKGRPSIDLTGDFEMVGARIPDEVVKFTEFVTSSPRASHRDIAKALGIARGSVGRLAERAGYEQHPVNGWGIKTASGF